jgi:hypothetical protein
MMCSEGLGRLPGGDVLQRIGEQGVLGWGGGKDSCGPVLALPGTYLPLDSVSLKGGLWSVLGLQQLLPALRLRREVFPGDVKAQLGWGGEHPQNWGEARPCPQPHPGLCRNPGSKGLHTHLSVSTCSAGHSHHLKGEAEAYIQRSSAVWAQLSDAAFKKWYKK